MLEIGLGFVELIPGLCVIGFTPSSAVV